MAASIIGKLLERRGVEVVKCDRYEDLLEQVNADAWDAVVLHASAPMEHVRELSKALAARVHECRLVIFGKPGGTDSIVKAREFRAWQLPAPFTELDVEAVVLRSSLAMPMLESDAAEMGTSDSG